MPLVVDWDDPSNLVIKLAMIGDWTWKELYIATLDIQDMLEGLPGLGHLIVDARYAVCTQQQLVLELQRLDCDNANELLDCIVLVSPDDSIIYRTMRLMAQGGNHIATLITYCGSVNEARALLQRGQSTSGCA